MRAWAWYLRRGWLPRIAIGLPLVILAGVLLYVGARAVQYRMGEQDAGVFLPPRLDVELRVHDLAGHWKRIALTDAWRTIDRKILGNRSFRRQLNGALTGAGLPTLDELEDVRKGAVLSEARVMRLAGRDAAFGARIPALLESARFCVATRLRFTEFLLVPFARWALTNEMAGGVRIHRLKDGKREYFLAFSGSVAVVSNDAELLAEALGKPGRRSSPARPVEGRMEFERSRALADFRKGLTESGLFPYLKLQGARAARFSADAGESAIFVDVDVDGASAAQEGEVSESFRRFIPAAGSGYLATSAGIQDIYAWLKSLGRQAGGETFLSKNAREAFEMLESVGFAEDFLTRVDPGLILVTGGEEREGRMYPGLVLIVPSKDPKGALEAINATVQKISGKRAEGRREMRSVGDVDVYSWRWPEALEINDFLRPCYAALPGAVVFGNNVAFTETVIDAASGRSGAFDEEPAFRAALRKLKEYSAPGEGPPASGFIFLPALRASLDGLLPHIARSAVYSRTDNRKVRAEIEMELRRQGRTVPEPEIVRLFEAEIDRRKSEKEEDLRAWLRPLESLKWACWRVRPLEGSISLRWVVETRP